jgi:signal transduction histidine kinase
MRAGSFMHSRARILLTGFDNARIRNKILTGFGAVVLPLIALGIATLFATAKVRDDFIVLSKDALPHQYAINEVETGTLRLLAAFNHLVSVTLAGHHGAHDVGANLGEVAEVRQQVVLATGGLWDALGNLNDSIIKGRSFDSDRAGAAASFAEIKYVALNVMANIESSMTAFDDAPPETILERAHTVQKKADGLKEWISRLRENGEREVDESATTLNVTIDNLRAVAIGGIAIAVVIALFVGLLISRRIARPIQALRQAAVKIGDGDFSVLDSESRSADEVGDLVAAFQETTRKLRDSQDKLARNERLSALGQIAGSVSHELRNPLGTIRNSMDIVRQLTANKGLGVERALDRIERSVQRCDVIVGDILEFSRVQELKREETSIDTWLTEMVDEHDVPAAVTLRRELAADAMVMLDRTRFRQVFVNLIDNATQAMLDPEWAASAGRPATMIVRSEAAGPHVRVSVIDNGPGIAEDTLERIFEPLFTTKVKGVGLGLPTVRKLVEQHGGTIDVESKIGEGTTFTVWLPRQPGQAHSEPAARLAASA